MFNFKLSVSVQRGDNFSPELGICSCVWANSNIAKKPAWPRLQFYCSFCGCRSVSWCRCSILSEISGSLQLLAVDYGRLFTELIGEVSGVPSQPADLRELPSQAIECHMPTVMPSGTEWGTAAGDLIYNNLQYSYTLVAKACITMIL